ncbi:MAG: hypothetical protein K8L97_01625 [Anaerolineae bacterium]|nr:hypothetical protein [Anaerolineae bacterium]
MTRYHYLGNASTDPVLIDMQCDPVRDRRGKCIVARVQRGLPPAVIHTGRVRIEMVATDETKPPSRSMGTSLVVDEDGQKYVVIRRRLRLNTK